MYISREISERLSENAWESCFGEKIPRLRFFTPNEKFWIELRSIKDSNSIDMFIDCGTGNGDLPKEARTKRDMKMAGIDIVTREGNDPCEVQMMPAHRMPSSKQFWLMACRPDHSGWVRALLEKCIEEESGFIYVGLRKNMAIDLGSHLLDTPFKTISGVGEEGEDMLVFYPEGVES